MIGFEMLQEMRVDMTVGLPGSLGFILRKQFQNQFPFGVSFIFHLPLKPKGITCPLSAHLSDSILYIFNL